MDTISYTALTAEQFAALREDQQNALDRERRALELAESMRDENLAMRMGLQHFTKAEVADLLRCSTKQLDRYAKLGKLVPTHIMGKILYSATTLFIFLRSQQEADYSARRATLLDSVSSFPKRKRAAALT